MTRRSASSPEIGQDGRMPLETVPRTWTIASWLVAHAAHDVGRVADALGRFDADAYALQSVREDDAERLADRLGVTCAWELSYHPRSRLLPGSGVGLAVLSRHSITDSASIVTNNHSSAWSTARRIAHFAVVKRADHSGYTIGHAVGSPDPESMARTPAPLVWFRPEQVGIDETRAVDLPDGSTLVRAVTTRPIDGASHLLSVTFDLPWVLGDFPVA
jgi:hypothetical protein